MLKANKYRIYPSPAQVDKLNIQFGHCRWVWNTFLDIRQSHYKETGKGYGNGMTDLPLLKDSEEFGWLKEADSQSLQQQLRNLDRAFDNFFKKRARYPKDKKRHGKQSFQYPQRVKIDAENGLIYLPKVGWVKVKLHREALGKIKTVTISKNAVGQYFASVLLETDQPLPELPKEIDQDKVTGCDMGLRHLLISDNGRKIENPKHLKTAQKKLAKAQKSLSRKKKGSASRAKARRVVAKCHLKVANRRNDYQHKMSNTIADESQAVIVETLKIKNMIKNRKLSKAIADAGWKMLIGKLEYKCKWRGKHFVKIDQFYPSTKTCYVCDWVKSDLELSQRTWMCDECGTVHDRDITASINIKRQGILKLRAEGYPVLASGHLIRPTAVTTAIGKVDEGGSPALKDGVISQT